MFHDHPIMAQWDEYTYQIVYPEKRTEYLCVGFESERPHDAVVGLPGFCLSRRLGRSSPPFFSTDAKTQEIEPKVVRHIE